MQERLVDVLGWLVDIPSETGHEAEICDAVSRRLAGLPQTRVQDFNQLYALEAKDVISLPLYVLPNVGAWRTDKIAGPVGSYVPSNLGMFYDMNRWYLASS